MDIVKPIYSKILRSPYNSKRSYANCPPYIMSLTHGGKAKCNEDFIGLVIYALNEAKESVSKMYKNLTVDLQHKIQQSVEATKKVLDGEEIPEEYREFEDIIQCMVKKGLIKLLPDEPSSDYIQFSMMRSRTPQYMMVQKQINLLPSSDSWGDASAIYSDLEDVELEINGKNFGKIYDLSSDYLTETTYEEAPGIWYGQAIYYKIDIITLMTNNGLEFPVDEVQIPYSDDGKAVFDEFYKNKYNLQSVGTETTDLLNKLSYFYKDDPVIMRFIYPSGIKRYSSYVFTGWLPARTELDNEYLPFGKIEFHVASATEVHQEILEMEDDYGTASPFGVMAVRWLNFDARREPTPVSSNIWGTPFEYTIGIEEISGINLGLDNETDENEYGIQDILSNACFLKSINFAPIKATLGSDTKISPSMYRRLNFADQPGTNWVDASGNSVFKEYDPATDSAYPH